VRTNVIVFPLNLEIMICTDQLFEFIAKERSTNIRLTFRNSVCSTSACPRDAFLHRTRLLLTATVNQQAAHLMSPPSIWGGFSSGRLCLLRPRVRASIAGSPLTWHQRPDRGTQARPHGKTLTWQFKFFLCQASHP